VAAEVIGWGEDVGTLTKGRFGDLIAVRGDPLSDVSLLQDVDVVVNGGLLFKHSGRK
jgi:imidazolonepropionase-like amidohydrolase